MEKQRSKEMEAAEREEKEKEKQKKRREEKPNRREKEKVAEMLYRNCLEIRRIVVEVRCEFGDARAEDRRQRAGNGARIKLANCLENENG